MMSTPLNRLARSVSRQTLAACLAAVVFTPWTMADELTVDQLWPLGQAEVETLFMGGQRLCLHPEADSETCGALMELSSDGHPYRANLRMATARGIPAGLDRVLILTALGRWSGSHLCFTLDDAFQRRQILLTMDATDPFGGRAVPEEEQAEWTAGQVAMQAHTPITESCLRFYRAEEDETRYYVRDWRIHGGKSRSAGQHRVSPAPWGVPLSPR